MLERLGNRSPDEEGWMTVMSLDFLNKTLSGQDSNWKHG